MEDKGIATIRWMANWMQAHGDERKDTAIHQQLHRARKRGEFPGAWKLNRDRTTPWIIPLEVAQDWLVDWLEGQNDDGETDEYVVL